MSESVYFIRDPVAAPVPLLVSIPHTGTEVPEEVARRFASGEIATLADTDWHLHELYDFVPELGAKTIYARFSRYVVDLNRPRERIALYPGRFETTIVPTRTFSGAAIYREQEEPGEHEIAERLDRYWQPYHDRIRRELAAIRQSFGRALLFDAHSITSHVPQLYEGELPGFMLGDADGRSCSARRSQRVAGVLARSGVTSQQNFPFKGGYITRSYGNPAEHVHALQLEMSQRLYMDEGPPFRFRADLAEGLRATLRAALLAFVGD